MAPKVITGDSQETPVKPPEVLHHYTAFITNKDKQLIELDGKKKGPLVITEGCTDVLRGAIEEIQRRLKG